MIGKRLVNTGEAAAFDPLQNFETVTYTGNGGTQKITGYIRKGAAFNGSSSYIETSNLIGTNLQFSASFWVNGTDMNKNSSDPNLIETLFYNRNPYILIYQYNGYWSYTIKNSSSSNTTINYATSNFNDNEWYHFTATCAGLGGAMNLYINGVNVGTNTAPTSTLNVASTGFIGAAGATSQNFDGKIDQVRIFNRELLKDNNGVDEIQALADETYADPKKSTTDYFEDGSGVALYELDEDANSSNFEQAAVFNGNSSKIDVGNQTWFDSDFTFSMWFYPQNASGTSFQTLAYKRDTAGGDYTAPFGLGLYEPNHGTNPQKLTFIIGNGGNSASNVITTNTYNVNSWNYVAVKISGTAMSITLNGIESTATFTGTRQTNTETIRFGNKYGVDGDYPFDGKLDQVRIYSSALSSGDVTKLYKESADVPTATLVAHYKLDGDATDATGSYNATETSITYSAGVYGGTPTNINFLGMAFQPDLVWIKGRTPNLTDHVLNDSVRGTNKTISSSNTSAEESPSDNGGVGSFDSNGFTTIAGGAYAGGIEVNGNLNGQTYVAWCWKAGGSVTPNNNTDGTITSTVSANPDAGFSIVKWTNDSDTSDTIGHGLSSAPQLYITKRLEATSDWYIYTTAIDGTLDYLSFTTTAKINSAQTLPTSDVFTSDYSNNEDMIAYCFHSVDGYQKVGSYTGNGTSKNIVTGFRPRFIMIKCTSAIQGWSISDSVRSPNNPVDIYLTPHSNYTEESGNAWYNLNYNSNGFTVNGSDNFSNGNGQTYIYLAIA